MFYLGSRAATGNPWVGDLAEVVLCDTDINSTHKAIMDNRFSYLYGLTYGSGAGKPVISSIAPAACTQYDLPFYLYANDAAGGYTATSVINAFDTPLVTEYINATQIRARMLVGTLAIAQGLAITVADTAGISAPTGLAILQYVDVPGVPNLHTTVPNTVIQFSDPTPIRVLGVGFTAATVIKVNGASLATTFIGAGEVRATLPATAFDVLPGPIITVSDPSGDSVNGLEITLSPWSPLLLSGLTGWWAADDVIVAGGKITQWNDKTGGGHHAVQATTSLQALYNASDAAFNGRPSATFDGVDDVYSAPAFSPLGTNGAALVFASVYNYTSVHGTGPVTQPYVNDTLFTGSGMGVAAHASPLSLYGYANDGAYNAVVNTALVIGQTQRCQYRVTANVLTLEVGNTVSSPLTFGTLSIGSPLSIGYIAFGTNNAINGKIATWVTCKGSWTAQDSICWKNWCRYVHGTTA